MPNPYAPPGAKVADAAHGENVVEVRYAGFWIRFVAFIIDSILTAVVTLPLLLLVYGKDYLATFEGTSTKMVEGPADVLISWVLPPVAIVLFWIARQATPGKMMLSMKIVDAETLGPLGKGQAVGRYLGYYVSALVLCLGFLFVAFDSRKQGWHDKLAGTVVIRTRQP